MMFQDRADAGRRLALRLHDMVDPQQSPVVLGLPRGGVMVAQEIARILAAPLDVLVVRKIGAPHQPELALGAVSDGDSPRIALNRDLINALAIEQDYLDAEIARQHQEVTRRVEMFRKGRPAIAVNGRTVIVVDDGMATGATVRAAILALRNAHPSRIILAIPVASPEALDLLRPEVDEIVCLQAPRNFSAVGRFYVNFDQTTDEEVIAALDQTAA